MKKDWQKDIHDRMGNYEMDAPEGLWEGISKGLAERKPAYNPVKAPRLSLSRTLFRAAGVAAVACIALLLGFFFLPFDAQKGNIAQDSPLLPSHQREDIAPQEDAASPYEKGTSAHKGAAIMASIRNNAASIRNNAASDRHRVARVTGQSSASTADIAVQEATPHVATVTSQSADSATTVAQKSRRRVAGTADQYRQYAAVTPQSPSRWTIGTGASGSMGSSTAMRSMAEVFLAMGDGGCSWEDNPMLGIAVFNQGREVKTEYKHHLPVRFGINAAYQLTNRLAIESGLTYTRLSSDMSEGTNENRIAGSQQLDYVGIPLNMRYKALTYRPFSLYMSAGLLAEQCVSGHRTKDYIISGKSRQTDKETITTKPLQMSVNASIGLQLDILHNIGIYAEPGISYYFDDKSSLNTIYKEKNLNFNLNVGLRYTLEGK